MNPLEENLDVEFKNNDFHLHYSFKMIKQANLESFFILMNTKKERLLQNSYLNRHLDKTDFLFPNIPKAFFIKPNEIESEKMINMLNTIKPQKTNSTNNLNFFDTESQNPVLKNDQSSMLKSESNKSKGIIKKRLIKVNENSQSESESDFEIFKMKFNNKNLSELEVETIYLELLDFENIIGEQLQIKPKTSSLGK